MNRKLTQIRTLLNILKENLMPNKYYFLGTFHDNEWLNLYLRHQTIQVDNQTHSFNALRSVMVFKNLYKELL